MINIRNLRKQALPLQKSEGGKLVLLLVPARQSVVIKDEEMSQDILIKGERGDIMWSQVADSTPATPSAGDAE